MGYKEIGYRIQIAREEAGLNQKELADRLGLSQSTLSNYEKGKRRLYLSHLQKIAQELNKPPDYFLKPIEKASLPADFGVKEEMGELFQVLKELAELSKEDRKSAIDFISWLKSRGGNSL
jgi:transcriptional regulator with XRE-family HTH domain